MRIPFLSPRPARVNIIRLQGLIAAGRRGALSDAALAPLLKAAFTKGKPVAVALAINSPGGSPVQSSLIGARIRRLADQHEVEVHAFVEDVAASGGYWLASSADKIWADDSSVLGSVGVISAGFGFHELIAHYGIERRVHTAGTSKSMLDPFRPERDEDVARLKSILEPIHSAFKAQVTARRGSALPEGRDLFTGEIWAGQDAVALGLADGIAHLEPKMRALFGDDVKLRRFGQRRPLLSRLGLSAEILPAAALDLAEERAAFARFGGLL